MLGRIASLLCLAALACSADDPASKEKKPEPIVYFDEGLDAEESMTRAAALAKKGDAAGAADAVRKALAEHGEQVLEANEGVFLPAWRVVLHQLQALPPEVGQAFARNGAEQALHAMTEARGRRDLPAQAHAARLWFAALPPKEVLGVALALEESGSDLSAAPLLEELLALPSAGHDLAARAAFALAVADARRGDRAALNRLRAGLPREVLSSSLVCGGVALPLSEALARLDARQGIGNAPAGRPSREPSLEPSWKRDIPALSELVRTTKHVRKLTDNRDLEFVRESAGAFVPLSEAVCRDRVVLHLGKSLFVYRLEDGKEDWTRGGERNLAQFLAVALQGDAPTHPSLAVDGDRVFATVVSGTVGTGEDGEGGIPKMDLVCHRLVGGKLLWELTGENEGKDLSFVGAPLVSGDRLYVAALEVAHPERMAILCLSAKDGKSLWRKPLASTSPVADPQRVYVSWPAPVCALERGLLYVCTGTGAFATLDPVSGDLLWGIKYADALPAGEDFRLRRALAPNRQRRAGALLPAEEGVWMAPSEEARFFLVDVAERRIRLKRRMDDVERYRFLVGLTGDGLVLGGPELGVYSAKEGLRRHWELSPGEGEAAPTLCDGMLLVPRKGELAALDVATFHPKWKLPLPAGLSGDVLACDRGIVLVSAESVSFFPWKP